MKRFLAELFVLLLYIAIIVIGIAIVWWIATSDLPFWVKFWLLK